MPTPFDALKPLAGRALEAALNRAVALDPDTRDALAPLDGRRVSLTLESPPLALEIGVHRGWLQVGPPVREADLAVRGSIGGLLGQLPFFAQAAARGRPSGRLHVSGDAALDAWIFSAGNAAVCDLWSAGRRSVRAGRHVARDAISARYRADLKSILERF